MLEGERTLDIRLNKNKIFVKETVYYINVNLTILLFIIYIFIY